MKRVAVATSGGRDSTALLHCTLRQAAPLGVDVVALHVHHGLMPQADAWLAQVQRQSRRWGVACLHRRLATQPAPGDSIEAWARRERYRALAEMAHEADCSLVLLAHHRRDQAETWLLQALRGAGAAGLSAMPRSAQREGLTWARPWLDLPRQAIEAYVRRHRLAHVEDDSNADPRFARSRLRLQLWPALEQAFPDAETVLTAAALQAQHAAALAAEAAALDLPPLQRGSGIALAPWLSLPPARRRNALQAWLAAQGQGAVSNSLLQRLLIELPQSTQGRWPLPRAELRLYRGQLSVGAAVAAAPVPSAQRRLDLSQPGRSPLAGWQGHFLVEAVGRGGVAAELLRDVQVLVRQGGERFRLAPAATARSLKKQFQARAVPAWARTGPLLAAADGSLLFVPGLGLDATHWADPGQPQFGLRWCPDEPPGTGPMGDGQRAG